MLSVRAKCPRLRVEYLATLDGETIPLALPEPRKAHVHDTDVLAKQPETGAEALLAGANDEAVQSHVSQAVHATSGHYDGTPASSADDPIDEDLMCSICSRPDDEQNMLVCNCKRGYHIYCLDPKLDAIPMGDWICPECATQVNHR